MFSYIGLPRLKYKKQAKNKTLVQQTKRGSCDNIASANNKHVSDIHSSTDVNKHVLLSVT